jgi:hypothetical protein
MKEFYADKIQSEEGAETVEIIIGIVVFVIFGLTVFGMITTSAGKTSANLSNCIALGGEELSPRHAGVTHADTSDRCWINTKYGNQPTYSYN